VSASKKHYPSAAVFSYLIIRQIIKQIILVSAMSWAVINGVLI